MNKINLTPYQAATKIQNFTRCNLARKRVNQIKNNAAKKIQKALRTYKVRENNAARVTKSQQAQLNVNNDTVFVPKLNAIESVNTDANGYTSAVDQVRAIISDIFSDIDQSITNQYITKLEKLKAEEQKSLQNMLLQIQQTLLKTQNENIKTLVKSVITEPVCYTGQKNTLMQVLESNQIPCETTSTFELQFNAMIISVINKLAYDILNDINERIFFNAPDPQSTHQIEPVRKWLDEKLGVYSGSYPEDVYNSITPFVNQMIEASFKRVMGNTRLSLDYWPSAITDEINENPNQCTMLCDYLNQIVNNNALSQCYSPPFINKLREELDERAWIADPPKYTSHDFKFILEKEGAFAPIFYPSEQLIREFLSVKLNPISRVTLAVNESRNEQTVREESFCLRHGIRENVIKAAHTTIKAVTETIKNLPDHWTQEETTLFFHIISQKHSGLTNDIQLSGEEISKLIYCLNEQNEHGATIVFIAAQQGHANAIEVLKELGANVNTPANDGITPVWIAAQKGHVDAIRILAKKGANVNTPMNKGATPVFIAA